MLKRFLIREEYFCQGYLSAFKTAVTGSQEAVIPRVALVTQHDGLDEEIATRRIRLKLSSSRIEEFRPGMNVLPETTAQCGGAGLRVGVLHAT